MIPFSLALGHLAGAYSRESTEHGAAHSRTAEKASCTPTHHESNPDRRYSSAPFPPSPLPPPHHTQLADYVGLDTTMNVLKNWGAAHPSDPTFRVPASLAAKVAAGDLGRKTGRGYYKWNGNKADE